LCDNVTQTPATPTTAEIITQTDIYFDISEIPPGAPQFNVLLLAHPTVHPEDFVTYRIMQEAHRRSGDRWQSY